MKFSTKSFLAFVATLVLILGLASVGLADEMGGMNMGGMDMGSASQAKQHEATSGMDPNMPGMGNSQGEQHEATPGMDPNMPGMDMGHDEESAPEGVNWFVVGGFLVVNFLVIGTAGVLKFTKNIPIQN